MLAALESIEIGDHTMFANGCFVGDSAHRFDDPDKPVTQQGFTSKGPVQDRLQLLARRQRRRDQRRHDRRPLRDRGQLGRHAATCRPARSPLGAPAEPIGKVDSGLV